MEDMNAAWKQIAQLQRAEAVLRMLCGSAMMAKVIWQVGLPMEKVLPATEQQRPLQRDVRNSMILAANETILNWLSMLGDNMQWHFGGLSTYQEHACQEHNCTVSRFAQ